jgi:hypothetical protein
VSSAVAASGVAPYGVKLKSIEESIKEILDDE